MASSPRRIGLTITLAIAAAAVAVAVGRAIPQGDRRIVSVTDFGAETGSRKNAVTAVRRALDACRRLERPALVFPKGRYDFWPSSPRT